MEKKLAVNEFKARLRVKTSHQYLYKRKKSSDSVKFSSKAACAPTFPAMKRHNFLSNIKTAKTNC